jgi:hypothetical protein
MKSVYLLLLIAGLTLSCSQSPRHPQAALQNKNSPAPATEASIISTADSIDQQLNNYTKRSSLIYHLDQALFHVEEYSLNGKTVLYKSYTEDEGVSNSTKSFYFDNDSLALVRERKNIVKPGGAVLEERRAYFRNNVVFKNEVRSSSSASELGKKAFSTSKQDLSAENFSAYIKTIQDALAGNDRFNLVFDNFLSTPEGMYILLKSKVPNGYSAEIRVANADRYTDSLLNQPDVFKDSKLRLQWEVKNKEAVYVPVEAGTTSARGLNR